jgi:hypothetical protein
MRTVEKFFVDEKDKHYVKDSSLTVLLFNSSNTLFNCIEIFRFWVLALSFSLLLLSLYLFSVQLELICPDRLIALFFLEIRIWLLLWFWLLLRVLTLIHVISTCHSDGARSLELIPRILSVASLKGIPWSHFYIILLLLTHFFRYIITK